MKRFFRSLALGILLALPWVGVSAQQVNTYCFIEGSSPIKWTPCSAANPLQITGSLSLAGTTSNASSAVATSSTNLPTVSYNYGFNGTTWDQLQVDGSKSLKVNVVTGGGGAQVDASAWTTGVTSFSPGGGVFNDAATLTSGQQGTARLTTKRATIVDTDTTGNALYAALTAAIPDCGATPCTNKIGVVGVNTWGGSTLGAGSNFGTTPGAVVVPGVNASMFMGTAIISATNGLYSNLLQGNTVISATNGLFANQLQGNAALSATNGGFQNILQGNAVLSATNGWYGNLLQGNAVLSATNGLYANLMVGNAAVATGTGAIGSTVPRFGVATDQATNAGAALVKGGVGTVNGGSDYETVAASQTNQALGATGATGDYLSHCVLQPTTTAAGTMTILDNATVIFTFTTGTLSNLAPIAIPIGANSVSGAWKVTTGANETATCFGKFT